MPDKVGAEAFLYLEPLHKEIEFAQCVTCRDWVYEDNRCVIHGPFVEVLGSMSCGLYVEGEEPHDPGTATHAIVSPTDSGLVDREVRCENCYHGGPGAITCQLFMKLNGQFPEFFDIDPNIHPEGCCNANTPRE